MGQQGASLRQLHDAQVSDCLAAAQVDPRELWTSF